MLISLGPIPGTFVLKDEVNAAPDKWHSPSVAWLLDSPEGDEVGRTNSRAAQPLLIQ